ncbi:hypothetical protein RvY_02095 [Ramazzottius varieornatus]|uniref:DDE-1 domain-containing protein n=1 Tax=Ramazzottius varieornatus TaxID=947166 RepID=A0A1D1UTQ1_RAMVA|nr:hypothetical protein RvY_02095 [Ramazzottius varieornatus]
MTIVRYEKSPTAQKIGRKTKLDTTEEALLVDMLIGFGNSGFPMNKHDLRSVVDGISFGKGAGWTPECAEDWISLLAKLESEGYLSDPAAIINFDESGFMLGFEKEKGYAARGMKHVPSYPDGTTRYAVSTLFCGDAAGKMYKPLVLFDGIIT